MKVVWLFVVLGLIRLGGAHEPGLFGEAWYVDVVVNWVWAGLCYWSHRAELRARLLAGG